MSNLYPCFLICLLLAAVAPAAAQVEAPAPVETTAGEWGNPFAFPILLSGNFGELRGDHFHAGIDFKTQNVEGKTVHAVREGYVSRVSVSPWGYGNALYINHPDGATSVYGHLQRFTGDLSGYVREQQYIRESFAVDLTFGEGEFPVMKGEAVALAGNTGSSAGPHLHFEIRNTATGMLYDPLEFYKGEVKDSRPPRIDAVKVYPLEGRGVVNGGVRSVEMAVAGKPNAAVRTEAWGEIGLAVKAYDYMDGTTNIYGVERVSMAVDDHVVFDSHIRSFPPDETRYINSFIDFEAWKTRRTFFMKTFVEPGNRLSFVVHDGRGIIRIDEERAYHITFRLKDLYGNTAMHTLVVHGVRRDIPAPDTHGDYFHWKSDNRFGAKGVRLLIPSGNLYDDIYFRYKTLPAGASALSDTHVLHDRPVPLHNRAHLSIRLTTDTLDDKGKYGIVRLQNKRAIWIGGVYRDRWMEAPIRDLGSYAVMQDVRPPLITPLDPSAWTAGRRIVLRISDDLSGVYSYRGEIDGQFALFELDGKKGVVTYHFDRTRLMEGEHKLRFILVDACGNRSEYNHSFVW
ncbi:MAG: M23 family metallopeptidase [Tannerellaceae bacterium]|jgi:murein DD-endopeptidase MepM/ murein hydrolase activator NlpD|nr:M23 family metallopeptidase [Tannerellaceae bacterium]